MEAKTIEGYISQYDRIFVLENIDCTSESFFRLISLQTERKILTLVLGQRLDKTDVFRLKKYKIDIQLISSEEYCFIKNLYYMYEFSECIHVLTDNIQYGSLVNYVTNGLLTKEEALNAFLK
ncbi:hypothetical protein GN277_02240 [Lachnospiraceae bacterium WCA-9-b2]|uniref:Uncharacterized protein n=1 Tax=Sporofaciens musculi TaxID=2681861 RepID=A0A7X3MD84_9FIRM|nr:hypothetical protein [Sporofaciens musculi]MCI9422457.1 hypothetical protein [Dorea sp.]MXP74280.1 hypothetical protein [Sporofaciens musculi]